MSARASWLRRPSWLIAAVLLLLLVYSLQDVGLLNADRLQRGWSNTGTFLRGLFPPEPEVLEEVSRALLETVEMAFAGTLIGTVLAVPLALAASRSVAPLWLTAPVKLLLAVIRTIPSLLWALIFVVAVGLGPAAGTLAVSLYTVGFLGKMLYELFEGVDVEVLEAVRGVGCSRLELARYAILPDAANAVLAQILFVFEYNVRSSAILGFVGAGGIGFYLSGYLEVLEYQSLLTAILVTLAAVLVIDRLSSVVRAQLR